jgi:hypothetical protein
MKYDIEFLDHGGKVFSSAQLEAVDDSDAIDQADRVHRNGIGSGYKILRGGVVVHFEEYGPVAPIPSRRARQRRADA